MPLVHFNDLKKMLEAAREREKSDMTILDDCIKSCGRAIETLKTHTEAVEKGAGSDESQKVLQRLKPQLETELTTIETKLGELARHPGFELNPLILKIEEVKRQIRKT